MAALCHFYAMKLYLMRHANADWPDWDDDDDSRPLTDKGHAQAGEIARQLRVGHPPRLMLSSPLPRAMQTAQALQQLCGGELRETAVLQPGAPPEVFLELLRETGEDVLMVGHEPDLSLAVLEFTGEFVKMRKANVACLEFDENFTGRLVQILKP
jgi:phosphohistidine phosphatase